MPWKMIPRCKERMDQCDDKNAIAEKIMTKHAYKCPYCNREYLAMHAWMYADFEYYFDES